MAVDSLHDAVEALQAASTTPVKQRSVKVSVAVDAICRHAFEDGLDPASLQAIIKIVTRKTELDQTSLTNIIKNLYPAQRVPADVVIAVVSGLGQGKTKPSSPTQTLLVKWLITIYEVLEDATVLSRLYGVLFAMLDMISLRTPICYLLSLVTRRKHVRPFRIQQLLELSRGMSNEPALQGLLRIYKDYYPDIIVGSSGLSRGSFPPHPNPEWRTRLLAIQEASARRAEGRKGQHNGFRVLRLGSKRSKASIIPEVHTFYANESSVTLEEIDSVDDLVGKLDKIELPGQIISFLRDPLLQKYLSLNPSKTASTRIDLWLSACLEDEFEAAKQGATPSVSLSEILEGILSHTRYTKSILPVADAFLKAYLPFWDGLANDDAILNILAFLPIQSFQDVHSTYFASIEAAMVSQNPYAHQRLLTFYTSLMRHWTVLASSQASTPTPAPPSQITKHITDLINHVSTLSLSILSALPYHSNSPVISSLLSFYELLSVSSLPNIIPIVLPTPHLTYLLLTSPSLATLSRLCTILANYKNAFDTHPTPISAYYPVTTTNMFNGYLMDSCNLLWRSRALLTVDANALGIFCAPPVRESLQNYFTALDREYVLSSAFGLSHNALLAALSAAAWSALEEAEIQHQNLDANDVIRHKGPVLQRTLTVLGKEGGVEVTFKQYRVQVLKWLDARGCGGIKELMFATMTGLKDATA